MNFISLELGTVIRGVKRTIGKSKILYKKRAFFEWVLNGEKCKGPHPDRFTTKKTAPAINSWSECF